MNLILLFESDFTGKDNQVCLTGRRHTHIRKVIHPSEGDTLKIGLLNGNTGIGIVKKTDRSETVIDTRFTDPPPRALPVTLILALPRPKVIKRVIQSITAMGVKRIFFINAFRVEKSFWQSPVLEPETLYNHLILGLEQAKDTILPEIRLCKGFKPFAENILPDLLNQTRAIVAHPVTDIPCPRNVDEHVTLAIGPEGGFIPYEIDMLIKQGFTPVHIGNRILKVETAIPAILGRLF